MRKPILAIVITLLIAASAMIIMSLTVRHAVTDETGNTAISSVPLGALLQYASGARVTSDFMVDYASAVALRHGEDPYQWSSAIFDQYGMLQWPVNTANPHPPTMVAMALPFSIISYQNALAAWAVLMIGAVIGTFILMGVRIAYAWPLGIAVCMVSPAAYGLGNVVPVIGFGIALAYRFRDRPVVAALGLMLAATPKTSGLILVVPFLLTYRWKAALWTAVFMLTLALVPIAFFAGTWSRYLSDGVQAITANAARSDNAAILHLASSVGVPFWLAGTLVVIAAAAIMLLIRDLFWPTVWLIVALLPIGWMYSLLTLIPLLCAAMRRPNPWSVGAAVLSAGLAAASPPYGMWPTFIWPIILFFGVVALLQIREMNFWPDHGPLGRFLRRLRGPAARSNQETPTSTPILGPTDGPSNPRTQASS